MDILQVPAFYFFKLLTLAAHNPEITCMAYASIGLVFIGVWLVGRGR